MSGELAMFQPPTVDLRVKEPFVYQGVHYDNREGLGSVPMGSSINYNGIAIVITPRQFEKLAKQLAEPNEGTIPHLITALQNKQAIGSPFLSFDFETFRVTGHEGRHRARALTKVFSSMVDIIVHIFPTRGMKARDITPAMIERMASGEIKDEYGIDYTGGRLFDTYWHQGAWHTINPDETAATTPVEFWTPARVEHLARYAQQHTFKSEPEAQAWVLRWLTRNNIVPDATDDNNKAIALATPLAASGKSYKIGKVIRAKSKALAWKDIDVARPNLAPLQEAGWLNPFDGFKVLGVKELPVKRIHETERHAYTAGGQDKATRYAAKITGDQTFVAIVVDTDGVVLDGHHRLVAVRDILGWKTIPCLLIRVGTGEETAALTPLHAARRELVDAIAAKKPTPAAWRSPTLAALKKYGFKKLGAGAGGVVYGHPTYPYVIKAFRDDPAFRAWYKFVSTHQSNVHVPKLRGKLVRIGETNFIRMEKLTPLSDAVRRDWYTLGSVLALFFANKPVPHTYQRSKREAFENMMQKLADDDDWDAIAQYLERYEKFHDLHPGNFMMRGDTMVCIDPIFAKKKGDRKELEE